MRRIDLIKKWNKVREETGYRSQYEADVASYLPEDMMYEPALLPYPVTTTAHYKPDFCLPSQCIVIEAKGRFTKEDRDKMLRVKQQYPELDIRMIFQQKEKITTKMTNLDWCEQHGFPAAVGTSLPLEWLNKIPTDEEQMVFNSLIFRR